MFGVDPYRAGAKSAHIHDNASDISLDLDMDDVNPDDVSPQAINAIVRALNREFYESEVTLTFCLQESVTPEIFAGKIALACARGGALRPGEAVRLPNSADRYVVSGNAGRGDETIGLFKGGA